MKLIGTETGDCIIKIEIGGGVVAFDAVKRKDPADVTFCIGGKEVGKVIL
jgi:hypothetical protein